MEKIIEYLKTNEKLTLTTLIVLGVLLLDVIFIILARKSVKKRRLQKKAVEEAGLALAAMKDQKSYEEADEQEEETIVCYNEVVETANEDQPAKKDTATTPSSCEDKKAVESAEAVEIKNETNAEKIDSKSGEADTKEVKKASYKPITDKKEEQQDAEKTVKKEAQKTPTPQKIRYAGKWLIYKENGKFAANLVASNGEVLLRTEFYSALSGIKSGIETIKNNIAKDNFAISMDKNENYFFKLFSSSTRLLCISEGYSTKAVCESAIESVKRFAKTAVLEIKKDEDEK